MSWNPSNDGKANIFNGYITSAPANVTQFGGVGLGPSSYQPVGYSLIERPSNSVGTALDLKVFYGGQTEFFSHVEGIPKMR